MVKSIKYILKRIFIGVGIALAIAFIRGNLLIKVQAKEISSYSWGTQTTSIPFTSYSYSFNVTGNPWANWRYGYLYFTFSTYSWGESVPIVRSVVASSDTANYICHIGSISTNQEVNNTSDQNIQVYSAYCPMDLGSPGLTKVTFNFQQYLSGNHDNFTLNVSNQATYESTEDIVLNQTDTTNAINNQTTTITNNQNQNTQQQIDSQMVCTIYDLTATKEFGYLEAEDGTLHDTQNSKVTDFIPLTSSDKLTLLDNATERNNAICFYNVNKSYISCMTRNQYAGMTDITIPNNTSYVRFTINVNQNKPQWKICKNGNQAISEGQQNINNTLNDSSGVADSDINELFGDLEPSDTPISDLLTMPLTLLNAYVDGFSATCQSINLGQLYGSNLIIPCINIANYLGNNLWTLIDVLFSIFMVYNIAMLFIQAFDGITSLHDEFSYLYSGVEGRHIARGTRMDRYGD